MHDTGCTRSARTPELEEHVLREFQEQSETNCNRRRKCEPYDGLANTGSRRPSTRSCAACARLESNRQSATCRFFTMLPPTIGRATRLCHRRAIPR
ncbi:hypothetical protein TNCV_1687981 [Trichonephila clavipes]|nr:hypothetical protein TNCV_1687981 [Trichonephila clavipes]